MSHNYYSASLTNLVPLPYIVIGRHSDNVVKIADTVIERIESIKYLGVIIDDRLNIKEHCEYINP